MPIFLRYASYIVFFWVNENDEPIHFHVSEGRPSESSTKIWILSDGSFLLAHNKSRIPVRVLNRIFQVMQDNIDDYKRQWEIVNGSISYYK